MGPPSVFARRTMRQVTGMGLLPGTAKRSPPARRGVSGLAGPDAGIGSCAPGQIPDPGPQFTGAGPALAFLRENFLRDSDVRHRVLEGLVPFDPTIGKHVIPLSGVRIDNPGQFKIPFGMVFMLVNFQPYACDGDGEISGCAIPNVVFNLSKGLRATVYLNGRGVAGMLACRELDHDFDGLGVKIENDFVATYEVLGVCPTVPTLVGVVVKGYLLSRELWSEAFDTICPSGSRRCL